jgi:superfamily II DNA or RNA helicase
LQVIVRNTNKKSYDNKPKTRIAINIIKRLINADPNITVLISVPTDVLKEQWMEQLVSNNILSNCKVEIINSIIKRT